MRVKKKIVFVIVEGISDQIALAAIMSNLLKTDTVIIEFIRGDITSEFGVSPQNIASKIGSFIKEYSKIYAFKASDYLEVIHIIDTDGTFMRNDKVIYSPIGGTHYDVDSIVTAKQREIIKRNELKAANVHKLISLPKVWGTIPYSIYFFSCNLDHVLHDNANLFWKQKDPLASEFAKRFRTHPEDFLAFIQDDTFAIKSSYSLSWEFIVQDENSLKKYTNFNLIFGGEAKNVKRTLI